MGGSTKLFLATTAFLPAAVGIGWLTRQQHDPSSDQPPTHHTWPLAAIPPLLLLFGATAAYGHAWPSAWMTKAVKVAFIPVALLPFSPWWTAGALFLQVSLPDRLHLHEGLGALRQAAVLLLLSTRAPIPLSGTILGLKALYFMERSRRKLAGRPLDYGITHGAEHVDVALWVWWVVATGGGEVGEAQALVPLLGAATTILVATWALWRVSSHDGLGSVHILNALGLVAVCCSAPSSPHLAFVWSVWVVVETAGPVCLPWPLAVAITAACGLASPAFSLLPLAVLGIIHDILQARATRSMLAGTAMHAAMVVAAVDGSATLIIQLYAWFLFQCFSCAIWAHHVNMALHDQHQDNHGGGDAHRPGTPRHVSSATHLSTLFDAKLHANTSSAKWIDAWVKPMNPFVNTATVTWSTIGAAARDLGRHVGRPDLIVGVVSGGAFVASALRAACFPHTPLVYIQSRVWSHMTEAGYFVALASLAHSVERWRGAPHHARGGVEWWHDEEAPVDAESVRRVLVVDDSVATGKTLARVVEVVRARYPHVESITTAAMYSHAAGADVCSHVWRHQTAAPLVWPWGLEAD